MLLLSTTMGVPFHEVRQWSSAEISLYMAYYGIEPWGEYRADLRNALAIKHNLEAAGAKPKFSKSFELTDFLLFWKRKKPSGSALLAKARALFGNK